MGEIWVIADHKDGKPRKVTYELLGKADELAKAKSQKVGLVVLAGDAGVAEELKQYADKLYLLESEHLKDYNCGAYMAALTELIEANNAAGKRVQKTTP